MSADASYILTNLLKSLRELKHKDLENGVHVQLANAIEAQIPESFVAEGEKAFTKETLMEAYSDAMDTIRVFEFRLDGIKLWAADAFMSAREAKWKGESGEKAVAKILDFLNGDHDWAADKDKGVEGMYKSLTEDVGDDQ